MIFGPETTTTIGDLRPRDFVVSFPAQHGIRACVGINASVRDTTPSERWQRRRPRARYGIHVPARRVTFNTTSTVLDVPSHCTVVIRRPEEA